MPTIIKGKYGIGYRQSPYLFNNIGFRAIIAEGNRLGGVTAKSEYVWFFSQKE